MYISIYPSAFLSLNISLYFLCPSIGILAFFLASLYLSVSFLFSVLYIFLHFSQSDNYTTSGFSLMAFFTPFPLFSYCIHSFPPLTFSLSIHFLSLCCFYLFFSLISLSLFFLTFSLHFFYSFSSLSLTHPLYIFHLFLLFASLSSFPFILRLLFHFSPNPNSSFTSHVLQFSSVSYLIFLSLTIQYIIISPL